MILLVICYAILRCLASPLNGSMSLDSLVASIPARVYPSTLRTLTVGAGEAPSGDAHASYIPDSR